MYHNILLEFLEWYECDPTLLYYIIACKGELQERTGYVNKVIELETSVKFQEDGKIIKGRYVITVILKEVLEYDKDLVKEMFSYLGFDFDYFNFEEKKNVVNYLYLGIDGYKGKVYLGNENSGICFESNNKIKFYKYSKEDIVEIFSDKEEKNLEAIHIRINNYNNFINWYGISKKFITLYFRPNLNGFNIDDDLLIKANKWYYHKCLCKNCVDKDLGGKNIHSLITIIKQMDAWYIVKLFYIIYKIIEIVTI
jgi:hypothetical protein